MDAHAPAPPRRTLIHSRRGVAAMEFGLMAPVIVFLLAGMYDFSNGWITWRKLTSASYAVGQIATRLAVQPDSTNALGYTDAWRASTAAYAAMPQLRNPGAIYAVTLSEVVFSTNNGCTGGSYCVAKVTWSATLLGNGAPRPCVNLNSSPDTAAPSPITLAASAFPVAPVLPAPIFIVDVTYTYTPLFLQTFIGTIPMRQTAYFPSRSGSVRSLSDQIVTYSDPNNPGAQCPASPPPS